MTTKYLGEGRWARVASIDSADIMLPIERQGVYAEPIQTHNAVSVGTNATSTGSWIQSEGFDKVGVNVNMTSGTGMVVTLETSFDGSTKHGGKVVYDGTESQLAEDVSITAPYIRVAIKNKATGSKTTTGYAYLKA